ncbi:MAG: ABC transporter permease [Nitrospirae bacterium]|nr:ABC transporter permease [Nitrospirota bacterium]
MHISIFGIAKRNLKRKFFRSVAIALSVAVVAGTLFSITTVMESVELSIMRGTARLGADVMVVPSDAELKARAALLAGDVATFYMPSGVMDSVRRSKGVAAVSPQIFIESATFDCCDIADLRLIGFDPATDFTITPWLKERLNRELASNEILVGHEVARETGQRMKFYGNSFTVAGKLESTGMRFIDNSVFMPMQSARRMISESATKSKKPLAIAEDRISAVLVQVDPAYQPAQAAIYIENAIKGVKSVVSEEVISSVRKQLFVLLKSILMVSVVLWIMALLMIGVIFSMIVNERQREIGLLRAMGARRNTVFGLIMLEAAALSALGGVVGIAAGGVLLFSFKNLIRASLHIPYLWPEPSRFALLIAVSLALAFLTGIAAALYPAARSSRMEPFEAIRKGD